ncbi:ATP-binding cassette domain-containing protein [Curtobacterium sp. MCLR17_036]|uniref:ATP-binding cassette domain-containing protein n=1 Tax=Curtobacterium sp. MCLR17_036 TaxID=2175620 RepID=UPI000DAA537C|nr:ATP-binding cassette domain-containing protein [Curtobacterium sp. MCLR17_036]WIE65095.1 ATP-binding cassette domain-containing protein [Curtobacterium sp. MCLR17_036]
MPDRSVLGRTDHDGVVVDVDGLSRRFGDREVVSDVSFSVRPGRVTGFLGPNGAGKTTTLRMMLDLLEPTAGRATFDGVRYRDLARPSTVVGASLESSAVARGRRGRSHLLAYAAPAHAARTRVEELLDVVGLAEHARRRVGDYSLGMQQRLALATALLGDPDVLVLDEPANGLDPSGVYWLRTFLRDFAASGRTVLLSSHMLAEMELIADDVVLIDRGRTVFTGCLSDLLDEDTTVVTPYGPDAHRLLEAELSRRFPVEAIAGTRLLVSAPVASVSPVVDDLVAADPWLRGGFSIERLGLEAAFLARVAPEVSAR